MSRTRPIASLVFFLAASVASPELDASFAQAAAESAAPLYYFSGEARHETIERDDQGGNPFASALIDALKEPELTLGRLSQRLALLTFQHAGGWQRPELPRRLPDAQRRLVAPNENRVALIIAVSDYSKSPGVLSLSGARTDEARLKARLAAAGFATVSVVNADRAGNLAALEEFRRRSAAADVAVIYAAGHGVQHGGGVYLMMGDYPERSDKWLKERALNLREIGDAARAKSLNLVMFGGCRNDPFSN